MTTVYLVCALLGGTLLLLQGAMSLLGLGGDHDLGVVHDVGHDVAHDAAHDHGHEHHQAWFVGVLSFRSLVALVTFFGIGGMIGSTSALEGARTFGVAVVCGVAAMFLVAWMMRTLARLRADGTVRIESAVGAQGTVYLPIPGRKAGVGKVTLTLQGRTVELAAVTDDEATLPTGAKVVTLAVVNPQTVEVSAA